MVGDLATLDSTAVQEDPHRSIHSEEAAKPGNHPGRSRNPIVKVAGLDELAASGEYLRERGHKHSWGIGRHIQGSQIFDYWRDGDGAMFEHYADGDLFDSSLPPGWAPMSASGLAQWGPKATRDFLGTGDPAVAVAAIKALAAKGNEITLLPTLRTTVKAMSS